MLEPPVRRFDAAAADHMAAMVQAARQRASGAERAGEEAAARLRAAEGFQTRVRAAVLALMRAAEPEAVLAHDLARLLHLDAARLCCEAAPPQGAARVPRGTVAGALGRRAAVIRPARPDVLLHGEAVALAAQEGLVRIPLAAGPALLALACRDGAGFAGASTAQLVFLGEALAAALEPGGADA